MIPRAISPIIPTASAEKEDEAKAKFRRMMEAERSFQGLDREGLLPAVTATIDDSGAQCSRNDYDDCSLVYPNWECKSEDALVVSS